MMHTPWPGPAAYDAAPLNVPVQRPDWTALDRLPVTRQFPTVVDLAQLWTVIRAAQRGESR